MYCRKLSKNWQSINTWKGDVIVNVMLRMAYVSVAMCITLCSFSSHVKAGTTGKIAGKVTDGETGEALPGVNVIIEGTQLGSATDIEG